MYYIIVHDHECYINTNKKKLCLIGFNFESNSTYGYTNLKHMSSGDKDKIHTTLYVTLSLALAHCASLLKFI